MNGPALGSEIELAGIGVTTFLWALGWSQLAPLGWRPGMPAPEEERYRG